MRAFPCFTYLLWSAYTRYGLQALSICLSPFLFISTLSESPLNPYRSSSTITAGGIIVYWYRDQYTKGMLDINPKGITPLGPYPDVEPGAPTSDEWKTLKSGGVQKREVIESAGKLPL